MSSLGTACAGCEPAQVPVHEAVQRRVREVHRYPNTATFETDDTGTKGSFLKSVGVRRRRPPGEQEHRAGFSVSVGHHQGCRSDRGASIGYIGGLQLHGERDARCRTDSGWHADGQITVTGLNEWEAVTLTSLTDVIDNGGGCTIDANDLANNLVVPASGRGRSGTCSYTTSPNPYDDFTHTQPQHGRPKRHTHRTGRRQRHGRWQLQFGTPVIVDGTVTVNDSLRHARHRVLHRRRPPRSSTRAESRRRRNMSVAGQHRVVRHERHGNRFGVQDGEALRRCRPHRFKTQTVVRSQMRGTSRRQWTRR